MSIYVDKTTRRLFIQFEINGKHYKKRFPAGTSKSDVEAFELKWKHNVIFGGVLPTDEPEPEEHKVLFEEFVENVYLPFAKANYSKDSFDLSKTICKAAIPYLGGKPLDEIKRSDLEKVKAARMATPTQHKTVRKPATIHREMSVIARILSMAVDDDLIPYNPMRRVKMPVVDNLMDKILPIEYEDKFLDSMMTLQRHICIGVLYTGLRQKDIFGLRKDLVDFRRDEIILLQGKTQRRVRMPLLAKFRAILEPKYNEPGDLFFPSYRKPGAKMTSIRSSIVAASAKIGLHLTIRDLRRTFGTRLHELGYDDKTVADLLGHSDLRSVHRYKRGKDIHKKAILDLGNMVKAGVEPAKILPEVLNGFDGSMLKPPVLLVETRGIEPLTSAMPLQIIH